MSAVGGSLTWCGVERIDVVRAHKRRARKHFVERALKRFALVGAGCLERCCLCLFHDAHLVAGHHLQCIINALRERANSKQQYQLQLTNRRT